MNFYYFVDKNQTDTTYSDDVVPIKTIDIFI